MLTRLYRRGELGKGVTYGKAIESSPYSNALKILILRCLMERPELRPDHATLLEETGEGVKTAANLPEDDNWEHEIGDLGADTESLKYQTGRFVRRNKRGEELRLSQNYEFDDETPESSEQFIDVPIPSQLPLPQAPPQALRENIAFPNYSNNRGGPGVNVKRKISLYTNHFPSRGSNDFQATHTCKTRV